MLDLQAIYLRDTQSPRDIRPLLVIQLQAPSSGTPVEVSVDGESVPFFLASNGRINCVRPSSGKQSGWEIIATVQAPDGTAFPVLYNSAEAQQLIPVLSILVPSTKEVVEVRYNNLTVPFLAVSSSVLLMEVPAGVTELLSISVITSTQKISSTVFFDYTLTGTFSQVEGHLKTVFQYIKLLLTTPGTDLLHPAEGGGVLRLIGKNVANTNDAVSSVLRAIASTTAQFIAGQTSPRLQKTEKLANVQVIGVSADKDDPTSVGVEMRMIMVGGASVQFGVSVSSTTPAGEI